MSNFTSKVNDTFILISSKENLKTFLNSDVPVTDQLELVINDLLDKQKILSNGISKLRKERSTHTLAYNSNRKSKLKELHRSHILSINKELHNLYAANFNYRANYEAFILLRNAISNNSISMPSKHSIIIDNSNVKQLMNAVNSYLKSHKPITFSFIE